MEKFPSASESQHKLTQNSALSLILPLDVYILVIESVSDTSTLLKLSTLNKELSPYALKVLYGTIEVTDSSAERILPGLSISPHLSQVKTLSIRGAGPYFDYGKRFSHPVEGVSVLNHWEEIQKILKLLPLLQHLSLLYGVHGYWVLPTIGDCPFQLKTFQCGFYLEPDVIQFLAFQTELLYLFGLGLAHLEDGPFPLGKEALPKLTSLDGADWIFTSKILPGRPITTLETAVYPTHDLLLDPLGMTSAIGGIQELHVDYLMFLSLADGVIAPHYNIKEKKAISVSHAILHLESMIGCLPVDEGWILYMGCVDPHLIYGCEVVLDTSPSSAKKFHDVQISFFRRLLGLSNSSVIAALFSETGIAPILFRRLELATRYLIYAILCPTDTYVYAAIKESAKLHCEGSMSWFTDLLDVMERTLPRSVLPLPSIDELLDAEAAASFHDRMKKSLPYWVEEQIGTAFRKTYLLQYRKEPNNEGTGYRHKAMCMWQYLGDIHNPRHRKAFIKLICGDHPLAVERLRWADNHRVSVPFEECLCRFCLADVENPEHALLECPHIPLAGL
ncbi:hypothetical protein K435DRAFT_866256 [Dendrothele bispora CBS 962.96]|uniref:F-box domain-containing protein n=1 Tax=Dendrothele bispora (strain CBS 962.96) TaxID=1314807 RepID=A0A4S8LIS4_DENBC|nr:hypothetical protein K435DRAFT_866256 [Dendrothele bispora CBS 962.96]